MFWNRNKIKKEMINAINPTSKASLKMQCLLVSNGDIEKAEKLYDFMAKDMPDMPMYDPVPPTTMHQIKDGAVNTMNWLKENKEDIIDLVGFVRGMLPSGGNAPTGGTPLPPIN